MVTVFPVERFDIIEGDFVREPVLITEEAFEKSKQAISGGPGTWPWRLVTSEPHSVAESEVHNGRVKL